MTSEGCLLDSPVWKGSADDGDRKAEEDREYPAFVRHLTIMMKALLAPQWVALLD